MVELSMSEGLGISLLRWTISEFLP
jgi:hypothetical protein